MERDIRAAEGMRESLAGAHDDRRSGERLANKGEKRKRRISRCGGVAAPRGKRMTFLRVTHGFLRANNNIYETHRCAARSRARYLSPPLIKYLLGFLERLSRAVYDESTLSRITERASRARLFARERELIAGGERAKVERGLLRLFSTSRIKWSPCFAVRCLALVRSSIFLITHFSKTTRASSVQRVYAWWFGRKRKKPAAETILIKAVIECGEWLKWQIMELIS